MTRSVLAFLLVPVFSPSLLSQQVHFQHLTIDDGLSQDIVTAIVQDDQGFMWFGTEDGLNQYDGTSFNVYKHNPNDSTTLSSNFVSSLLADQSGHLWVSTGSGIDLFDTRTRTFRGVAAMGGPHMSATGFCQGADSALWIGSAEGLFRCKNGKFSRADLDGQPMTHTVWGMLSEGNLMWVVDTAGLHCCVVQQEHLQSVELPPALHPLRGLSRIFRDREHQLWVCTWSNGIFRFDPTLGLAEHYTAKPGNATALRDNSVRTGLEDREGTLWFGTSSGLEKFDPSHDGFIHFESGPGGASGFLGDRVYALCVDRTGILWVGTYRGGVNTYAPARQKFRAMTLSPGTNAEDVFAVSQTPDGKILVGTDNGLYSWGGSADGSWIPYSKFEGKPILSAARLGNKDTWVGTEGSIERLGGVAMDPDESPSRSTMMCVSSFRTGMVNCGSAPISAVSMLWIVPPARLHVGPRLMGSSPEGRGVCIRTVPDNCGSVHGRASIPSDMTNSMALLSATATGHTPTCISPLLRSACVQRGYGGNPLDRHVGGRNLSSGHARPASRALL